MPVIKAIAVLSIGLYFTHAWEQRKLSSLVDFANGINAPREQYGKGRKMISVMDILSASPIKYHNIKNAVAVDKNTEQNYKVECGDLVFVRSSEVVNEVGWSKAYLDDNYALFSGFTIRGKKKEEFDSYFAELALNYKNRMQVESKAGGSTRFNVSQAILSNISFKQPSVLEQTTIGNFFRTLDDTITLYKRKLDKMKELKKGYLQKMFPQTGESVPMVRFADFIEPWGQRRLGEMAEIASGGTPSTSIDEYWNGDIDWYSPIEIGNKIFVDSSQKKITKIGLQKSSAKILPAGTVLFTSRAGIGNTAILAKEGATNQGFQSIIPNEKKLDSYFIFSRTDALKHYGETNGAGSTFVEVSGKQMAKMSINIPSLEEQITIGRFFRNLDDQLSIQQQKLDQLKQLKSSYLHKMFM